MYYIEYMKFNIATLKTITKVLEFNTQRERDAYYEEYLANNRYTELKLYYKAK